MFTIEEAKKTAATYKTQAPTYEEWNAYCGAMQDLIDQGGGGGLVMPTSSILPAPQAFEYALKSAVDSLRGKSGGVEVELSNDCVQAIVTWGEHQLTLDYECVEWDADGELHRSHTFKQADVDEKSEKIDLLPTYIKAWMTRLMFSPAALAARRKALGVTQEEFARFMNVSQPTVAAWEKGARTPADILGVMVELEALESHAIRTINGIVSDVKDRGVLPIAVPKGVEATYPPSYCQTILYRAQAVLREEGIYVQVAHQ